MSTGAKKAHPNAATLERVKGGAGLAGASVSFSNSTTPAENRQMGIGGE